MSCRSSLHQTSSGVPARRANSTAWTDDGLQSDPEGHAKKGESFSRLLMLVFVYGYLATCHACINESQGETHQVKGHLN